MSTIIGACGLVCSECGAYKATQANDAAAIAMVAVEWTREYNTEVKPEHVWCDGCMEPGERKCAHAASGCNIRACAIGRSVTNCALCANYPCEILTAFFAVAPGTRERLDAIQSETAI